MTQTEKEILLRDLSARLQYGVKGKVSSSDCNNRKCEFVATINGKLYDRFAVAQESWYDNVTIKPYLFPLSSMTEEQKKELNYITDLDIEVAITNIKNDTPNYITNLNRLNWLLKNHFDIYDLIPMGLANDATGLNIY